MKENINLTEALTLIRETTPTLPVRQLRAADALGCVIAQDILSPIDQPPFPRSPLDGYAFRSEDSAGASAEHPVRLTVVEKIVAGGATTRVVGKYEAVRIMTGAMIPQGADCVIRQEDTDGGVQAVTITKPLRHFENYCHLGEDFKRGDVLVHAGEVIRAAVLGVMAGAGMGGDTLIDVQPKPRVAVLCTGDEIVPPDGRPLTPGKIYNANEAILIGRLREMGYCADSAMLPDDPDIAAAQVREALKTHDLVITTGGVSVGEKDILHQVLPLLGAERIFWKCGFKPGGMGMYSLVDGKPVLSLSGNPFAAAASFELLGREVLSVMGADPAILPVRATAVLDTAFPKKSMGQRLIRGKYVQGHVSLPAAHESGMIGSMIGCNCLVDIPKGTPPLDVGTTVSVLLL